MAKYIECEKVVELFNKWADGYSYIEVPIKDAVSCVRAIPAADVRPVARGKWRLYSPLTDTYECDKCGYQVIDESFRTNFCPNCGADMREKQT